MSVPAKWEWFNQARFGMFIHWGPYAAYGRGEQVLFREQLDQAEYAKVACDWNPRFYDAAEWADLAVRAGMKYAVLTTRHHDGYCLWNSRLTDYTSAAQAPRRDFVREYAEAFRAAGLRVGLYYSLIDWRIPAHFAGPRRDPAGFAKFVDYIHGQLEELLTDYGQIDMIWFDGSWPHNALDYRGPELVEKMRRWQPGIMINNRLGPLPAEGSAAGHADGGGGAGESRKLGDFGTPEQHIIAEPGRLWEACMVQGQRLWGHTLGERYREDFHFLDFLCQTASQGGNLLLNVGPDAEGRMPPETETALGEIGRWLRTHGECVYGAEGGDVTEFVTRGYQIVKGDCLYLVIRFWDGRPELRLAGLGTPVKRASLLTDGRELKFRQSGEELIISGLPEEAPTRLFPVIKLECAGRPQATARAKPRIWGPQPENWIDWAAARGSSVWVDGKER